MDNLARELQEYPMIQEQGAVVSVDGENYMVRTPSGRFVARQAVSCLVQPLVGDQVLLTGNYDHDFFILAILTRDCRQKKTLSLQGDVDFRVSDGKLTLASDQGLSLLSPQNIDLIGKKFSAHAMDGEISIQRLLFSGGFWLGQVEKVKLIATFFDSVVERLTQKVKRSYRTVEDVDHLRAGRLDYVAKKLLSLRGRYSMITAKEDVKIDGERIHMG